MLARLPLLLVAFTLIAATGGDPHRALVDHYCTGCHSEKLKTGGIALQNLNTANVAEGANVWEKVLRKVRTGEMPPPGMPRPDAATSAAFLSWLESSLDKAALANPNPGRPAIHRLNRAEYTNAVRDLLALDINAGSSLPADDSGYGFDNVADVLTVSPILMERYMSLARRVSRLAIGDPGILPSVEQYAVPTGFSQNEQTSDDLPFGSRGGMAVRHHFPLDAEYSIRIRARLPAMRPGANREEELPQWMDVRLDGVRVKLFETAPYKGEAQGDQGIYEIRLPVKAGTRTVGVTFLRESARFEGVIPQRLPGVRPAPTSRGLPNLDYVEVGGPFKTTGPGDTPSRERIFVCRPASLAEEGPCANKILSTLARRAYRRPVTQADMRPLLAFYEKGRKTGTFETGIETALHRMLVSPDFIFRVESDPSSSKAGSSYKISNFELASRLSFFLWSSIPDDELLGLAQQGKLSDATVLEQQVRRMLADGRSHALVTNFAGQWLYLRNLSLVKPDPDAFPEFDETLRQGFERETELFFETILHENRSVVDLLNADFTFVNERLARHYDIPNVHGSNFRRVSLTDDTRRGLLGQGAVLTVTSYPTRTSAVIRGKWILENLLGAPPPPPPANVPDLKDHGENGVKLPLRQQMAMHRANPMCASCHARLDPIGFALENFDGVGKWRTEDANTVIDASGKLPDGTAFSGASGLRDILLQHQNEFVEAVTEKLLTYALGRGLEYYDRPVVRAIARDAARDDDRLQSIILGITKSRPFQMRRSREQ